MQIDYSVEDRVGVVAVHSGMNAGNIDSFKEGIGNWLQDRPEIRNVLVDLEGVESVDSSGLGALLSALKMVAERGGDLRVCSLQQRVRIVFEITRAYKLFRIYQNRAEALASFAAAE
jgi:anti-anti-sigma factor